MTELITKNCGLRELKGDTYTKKMRPIRSILDYEETLFNNIVVFYNFFYFYNVTETSKKLPKRVSVVKFLEESENLVKIFIR